MFDFLRSKKAIRVDTDRIGDRWIRRAVQHDGRDIDLAVRDLPHGFDRTGLRFVALIQPDQPLSPDQYAEWTTFLQRALESEGRALLAIIQAEPAQMTWYSYAGERKFLDEALYAGRATHPLRWGINEDRDWGEYDFCAKLAGG